MKLLTLIPPAQAEALFDALEERPRDRFAALPWQDDDSPEEIASQPRTAQNHPVGGERQRPRPQRRVA